MKTLIHVLTIAALPVWLAGCGEGGHSHDGHGEHADEDAPTEVKLTEAVVRKHEIGVENVSVHTLQPTFSVPARVTFNEETVAHVGALVSGRVSDMKAQIGGMVKRGEVLFVIESPELGRAQNAFLQALDAGFAAEAGIALAENNASVVKAVAEVTAAATQLVLAQKSAVVKLADADVNAAEALLLFAENSAAVNKAEADLKTTAAAVVLANNNARVTKAQSQLNAALPVQKRAREFFASGKKLEESGAIAPVELKRRETAMLTAAANVKTAQAALEQAKAEQTRDQQSAAATAQAATATLAQARAQQVRDITAAKAKLAAAGAGHAVAIAKKEQDIGSAKAKLAAAEAALQAAKAEKAKDRGKAESIQRAAWATIATARNQLGLFGMDARKISALQKDRKLSPLYTVRAPRNGRVVEREVTLGENVSPDQTHLLILADLAEVWVLMEVPPAQASRIQEGLSLKQLITASGRAIEIVDPATKATVSFKVNYISRVVDAETRTVCARVVVANHGGVLRPGQFLTAVLPTGEPARPQLAVPAEAVQRVAGQPTVYVQVKGEDFTYRQQAVGIGPPVDGLVPITSGLEEGDAVVVQGSYLLKAEFGKAAAGHDHSH